MTRDRTTAGRRLILRAVPAAAMTSLAGCSVLDGGGESEPEPETTSYGYGGSTTTEEDADTTAPTDAPTTADGGTTDGEEPLHVQTTPHSVDSGGPAAVERSTDRLVVAARDGEGDYEFSYTVTGTRDGHADEQVIREPSDGSWGPATADD